MDPKRAVYSASKLALEGLMDSLRRELTHFPVSVSIIQPAMVNSAIHGAMIAHNDHMNEDTSDEGARIYPSLHSKRRMRLMQQLLKYADDPIVTSEAILHAVSSAYPQTRYRVANALKIPAVCLVAMSWVFPDRVMDLIINNQ